ncbi:disulfide bond formation protein DsbB [Psychromonas hadalis]|uniref:disulfide bond formation protein DsbB n=1 Tax=Psychromonas hadalis TaxID=211669 RepID=UPI0003B2E32B|nr:disulfide bond formation protein DsbB [Psychromonas hadalis]
MLSLLKNLSSQRWPWLLLAFSALVMELCALYFQHVMALEPCVMCVYERVTMLGIILAGLVGATAPQYLMVRLIAFAVWAVNAVWGLLLAIEHSGYQMNPSPFATCDFFPNFPSWAPLHEWMPWLFNPTGDCADIVWQFFGYSMPQWLIVSFTIYCVLFVLIALTAILPNKKSSF